MKKFNNNDNYSSRPRFGNRNGGEFERGERRMFQATCAQCGRDCEVPFKPTGERPIYCSNCYEGQQGNRNERNYDDRRPRWNTPSGRDFGERQNKENNNWQQLAAIESKLDKILKILSPAIVQNPETTPIVTVKKAKKVKKETLLG